MFSDLNATRMKQIVFFGVFLAVLFTIILAQPDGDIDDFDMGK